jgi:hypothetical protein
MAPADSSATFRVNVEITPVTFSATGVGAISYSAASLPDGLLLDPVSGQLAGTPVLPAAATPYTVVATDADDSLTSSTTITITVLPATIDPPTQSVTAIVGVPFTTPPLSGVGFPGPVVYSIEPAPPLDWTWDPDTGVLGAALAAPLAQTDFTVTGASGATTATATVSIRGPPAALSPSSQTLNVAVGSAVAPVLPAPSGFATTVEYGLSPSALPAGLSFTPATGVVSGSPSTAWPTTVYTVTGADGVSSATSTFDLTVVAPPLAPATQTITATTGTAITATAVLQAAGLSPPITYAITPPLPAGLALNATTGVVTGKPTVVSALAAHTITATDANKATSTGVVNVDVAKGQLAAPVVTAVQQGTTPGSLRVAFTASSNAPIGQVYAAEVTDASSGSIVRTVRPVSTNTTITGLTPGAPYEVVIIADGSVNYLEGRSAPRSGIATAAARMTAPTIVSLSGGTTPGSVQLTFTAAGNAPPGQTYTVNVFDETQATVVKSVARAVSPAVITGLTPGTTYYVVVSADASADSAELPSRGRTVVATPNRTAGTTALPGVVVPAAASIADSRPSTRPTRLGGGWSLVPADQAATAKKVSSKARPGATIKTAPKVAIPRGRAVMLRVKGLPAKANVTIEIRVKRVWISLGSARASAKGLLVLPVFRADTAGTFAVRFTPSTATAGYLALVVKRGEGGSP